MQVHHRGGKRYRPKEYKPQRRKLKRRWDMDKIQRFGLGVKIFGIVVLTAAVVFAGYVLVNGVWPYLQEQRALASASRAAMGDNVSSRQPDSHGLLGYDSRGLPVYTNEVSLRVISDAWPAEADDVPELGETQDGVQVDERILPALAAMQQAAGRDGVTLTPVEGYVSYDEQADLFNAKVASLEAAGSTHIMAINDAAKEVARAGMSDQQTGLCVRFGEGEAFAGTEAYRWLDNNAMLFGFTLRFPEDKEASTGRRADAGLLRYVGADNAYRMRMLDMSLEEYIRYLARQ